MQKPKIINFIKNIALYLVLCVTVLSCSSHIFVYTSNMEQSNYVLQFKDGNIQNLSAVCSNNICKFIVLDILGMPVVSKELSNNKFRNTKFLPPNRDYDMLFVYIVETKGVENQFLYKVGSKSVTVYKNN